MNKASVGVFPSISSAFFLAALDALHFFCFATSSLHDVLATVTFSGFACVFYTGFPFVVEDGNGVLLAGWILWIMLI